MSTPEERAIEALEGMAETWAERTGLGLAITAIPVNCTKQEHQERARALIRRLVINSYMEGLYAGYTAQGGPQWMDAPTGPGWWVFTNENMEACIYFPKPPQDVGDPMMLDLRGFVAYTNDRPYRLDVLEFFQSSWWSVQDWEGQWRGVSPEPPVQVRK